MVLSALLAAKLSVKVALTACWAALHTMQYGFAITSLNGIQQTVTCNGIQHDGSFEAKNKLLKDCIPMTSAQFGLVVSILTLGGLLGSLSSNIVTGRLGKAGTLRCSAIIVSVGSAQIALANSIGFMAFGRIIVGIGCGLSTVTVPVFLAEIAPSSITRSLGIMNQVFIVMGMLIAQSLSFPFAKPAKWRYIFVVAFAIAIFQLCASLLVQERTVEEEGEEEPLLNGPKEKPMSIKELLLSRDSSVYKGFLVVLSTQISQQICGVAPVMYFSTRILTPVFGNRAQLMALFVVMIKIPITIVPAFVIEKFGSKVFLVYPTAIMCFSALLLAVGINSDAPSLSIIALMFFVTAFSVGLGPVTWVVLPEVMLKRAVTAAGSLGLAVNWILTFCMGVAFLPLQHWLSGNKESKEGNIFFILSATCAMASVAMGMAFANYERGVL
ncbi:uncharacterized protein L203_105077 [Cryptococcus depauperatus CBS 7841]|uniref:Major facilitator superfamily (MFS) profile domain-containing protein n=1 Tax=Cryptococcus depauperatus CBS 7841 TaxID=1295531 RepID=A0AAJ8JWS3_9TREE